ncbi:LysR substrate-binding domain-containing protein [Streptomyces sp. NPDC057623]|uniref:LysR substrate-binding domain-containing protein n=1 Tax=Streptomyces sp. NPDC057623 TaxID=3346187 RepID=UPI0036A89A45
MLDGTLDLAFAALPGDYLPGLKAHPMASEPILPACPDDHPLTRRRVVLLAELGGESFVGFPPDGGPRSARTGCSWQPWCVGDRCGRPRYPHGARTGQG